MPSEELEASIEIFVWGVIGSLIFAFSTQVQAGLDEISTEYQVKIVAASLICDFRRAYERELSVAARLPDEISGRRYVVSLENGSIQFSLDTKYRYDLRLPVVPPPTEMHSGLRYIISYAGDGFRVHQE